MLPAGHWVGLCTDPFFCVVLCWQNVKFCECLLGMPSFQCIGGGQCAALNALPDAGPGGAPKGASPDLGGGADSFFCVVLCWQSVKICECLLATPSFQCIGGGSVLPLITYRTLGWAAHQKARRLALAEAPMQFFGVASCWPNVKICECFLKMHGFHCIGARSVPPPPNWRTLGRAMCQKAHRLASAEAPILLCVSYCVNRTLKSVNVCLECPVFNTLGAAVCHPQSVAGRWAGRRAKKRVAWPWWRRQCKILGPYRVGKMLKFVSVFLKCSVFTASEAEVSRPH